MLKVRVEEVLVEFAFGFLLMIRMRYRPDGRGLMTMLTDALHSSNVSNLYSLRFSAHVMSTLLAPIKRFLTCTFAVAQIRG